MADYYTQFCSAFEIPKGVDKEEVLTWFEKATNPGEEKVPWREEDDDDIPFDASIEENSLIVSSEDSGNPFYAAEFVRAFYLKFTPNKPFSGVISYAGTCSRLRVDSFMGGCVAFTQKGVHSFYAEDTANAWLKKQKRKRVKCFKMAFVLTQMVKGFPVIRLFNSYKKAQAAAAAAAGGTFEIVYAKVYL